MILTAKIWHLLGLSRTKRGNSINSRDLNDVLGVPCFYKVVNTELIYIQ